MSQHNISIIPGDWVKIELSQYDMNQGRVIFRYNDYASNHVPPQVDQKVA
jgi:translation initiation factor IF-1